MALPGLDRLRRGRRSGNDNDDVDLERQAPATETQEFGNGSHVAMREQEPGGRGSRLFSVGRPVWPTMFRSGGSSIGQTQGVPTGQSQEDDAESPKTPRFTIGLPSLPSTRLHLPHLTRTWTNGSNGPMSRPGTARPDTARGRGGGGGGIAAIQSPRPSQSRFPFSFARSTAASPVAEPEAAVYAPGRLGTESPIGTQQRPSEPMSGHRQSREPREDDPRASAAPSTAADNRSERRRRPRGGRDRGEGEQSEGGQRKFMFCFPWIKSRRVRMQILRCFVSGVFLTLLLAIYLALSITKNINNSEFTVLLILIILFTTIFFCHALIRLCMLVMRPRPEDERRNQMQQFMVPGGYAIPRQPIRVLLARDEEVAGVESDTNTAKPPAYGMWRESVRVDPNRLFWQRNDEAPAAESSRPSESPSGPRPPSYASDDGVSYVVEARPRSMAPTTEVLLPPHPSERGRLESTALWEP